MDDLRPDKLGRVQVEVGLDAGDMVCVLLWMAT